MNTGTKAAAILLLSALPAFAAGEDCIKVEGDLDRLACYDSALGRTPKTESLPASASTGAWQVDKATSKMTDATNVWVSVDSTEPVNCGWNNGQKIKLYFRCMEGKTSAIVVTGCHMASNIDGYGDIEFRTDKDKAQTIDGTSSTDNKSLGLWEGSKSIPFIKKMIGKQEVVMRMTPYGQGPFTVAFPIAGLEEAIKPLRAECKW